MYVIKLDLMFYDCLINGHKWRSYRYN
jgi:hypothetical protein